MSEQTALPAVAAHGAHRLPSVHVDSYNLEIKDNQGFIGDRASKGAFRKVIDEIRKSVRKAGDDPLGDEESYELTKADFDNLLTRGDPEAAGVLQGAIEDFSQEFAHVIRRFMKLKEWKDTERIAIGGGFRGSRVGELVIGRTGVLLKADGIDVALQPIHNDPDQAGLIGAVHLAPSWVFHAFDAVLAVDVGGTNIRAGVVQLNLKKSKTLSKAKVWKFSLWRHGDEEGVKRDTAITRLGEMLEGLVVAAKKKRIKLAPFIGIGCPGLIEHDGSIDRGAQNLPGNWESSKFNLPASIHEMIPEIGDHETSIVMHNDAVVQGLSEIPYMQEVERWGILTIGTGLGNARFSNRTSDADDE
ncbi:MAG: ROK family protein [Xanthobacteraceae bacterium]|nr:ROK family protein [Xanthobacteraceae bacterium]